jgi:hypothetical protein
MSAIANQKPQDEAQREAELRCTALLTDLDAQYKQFVAVRHTSVWGGSFEREHGAAMQIKPIVNKMFDTLIKLMEARSANDQAQRSGWSKT